MRSSEKREKAWYSSAPSTSPEDDSNRSVGMSFGSVPATTGVQRRWCTPLPASSAVQTLDIVKAGSASRSTRSSSRSAGAARRRPSIAFSIERDHSGRSPLLWRSVGCSCSRTGSA